MPFKTLGIKLVDFKDLIRLHVNLKRERTGLLSYRSDDKYHVGFYFSPVIKEVSAVFTYFSYDDKPPDIVAYSVSEEDIIMGQYMDSTRYVNIPVAHVDKIPHKFIDPNKVEISYDIVPVKDIRSLITIALSTHIESAIIPFIWYDEKRHMYALNVEASSDNEEAMVIFTYGNQDYLGKYVEVDYKNNKFEFVSRVRDISLKYVLVVRAEELPFFMFKNKEE
jgi:hypothetical protein